MNQNCLHYYAMAGRVVYGKNGEKKYARGFLT